MKVIEKLIEKLTDKTVHDRGNGKYVVKGNEENNDKLYENLKELFEEVNIIYDGECRTIIQVKELTDEDIEWHIRHHKWAIKYNQEQLDKYQQLKTK